LNLYALAILLIVGLIGSTASELFAHEFSHVLHRHAIVVQAHHCGDDFLAASFGFVDFYIRVATGCKGNLLLLFLLLLWSSLCSTLFNRLRCAIDLIMKLGVVGQDPSLALG